MFRDYSIINGNTFIMSIVIPSQVSTPLPVYPALHAHEKDPGELVQTALA